MFTIHDCEQGTEEWFQARLGKITASVFAKVVTTTGKASSQIEEVVNRAVAELVMQEPDETFQGDAMLRGKLLEDQALEFFNFTEGYQFVKCGFLDSGKGYGCSPDGIDQKIEVGLELKCPLAHTHLAYLVGETLPKIYTRQVQGALLVSGYKKWVFGSYHPDFPCLAVEVERDEKIIQPLQKILTECGLLVQEKYVKLTEMIGQEPKK